MENKLGITRYRFSLQKCIRWYPRVKMLYKVVKLWAEDPKDAYKQVELMYPGWGVSMFWPIV